MNIRLTNRQRAMTLDRRAWLAFATWLGNRLEDAGTGLTWEALSIAVVGDRLSAALNETHLHHPGPTDVLSFSYPVPQPDGSTRWSGEVVVNAPVAIREARARGRAPATELALYCIHGVLHLAGEDDLEPSAKQKMRRAERRWIQAAGREPDLAWVARAPHPTMPRS